MKLRTTVALIVVVGMVCGGPAIVQSKLTRRTSDPLIRPPQLETADNSHEASGCEYEGVWYAEGEFQPDACKACECHEDGHISCKSNSACPSSTSRCEYQGTWYDEGEFHPDACKVCECRGGLIGCKSSSACHSGASGCTYKGKWYAEGDFHPNDCTACKCRGGLVGCTSSVCHPSPCVDPEEVDGSCCQVCPNGPNCMGSGKVVIPVGGKFTLPDHNMECECRQKGYYTGASCIPLDEQHAANLHE